MWSEEILWVGSFLQQWGVQGLNSGWSVRVEDNYITSWAISLFRVQCSIVYRYTHQMHQVSWVYVLSASLFNERCHCIHLFLLVCVYDVVYTSTSVYWHVSVAVWEGQKKALCSPGYPWTLRDSHVSQFGVLRLKAYTIPASFWFALHKTSVMCQFIFKHPYSYYFVSFLAFNIWLKFFF